MKKITVKNYAKLVNENEEFVENLVKKSKLKSEKVDGKVKVLVESSMLKAIKSALKALKEAEEEIIELKKKPITIKKKKLPVKPKKIIKKKPQKPKKRSK